MNCFFCSDAQPYMTLEIKCVTLLHTDRVPDHSPQPGGMDGSNEDLATGHLTGRDAQVYGQEYRSRE